MFLGVFLRHLFEFLWFFPQLFRYRFFEGVVRLGGLHHAVNHGQTVFGVECWTPWPHYVHTDISRIELHRRMVNLGHESQGGCLERILRGEFNAENKFSAGVRGTIGTLDLAIPFEHVLLDRANVVDEWERFFFELRPFLLLLLSMNEMIESKEKDFENQLLEKGPMKDPPVFRDITEARDIIMNPVKAAAR